jgi:HK97 family phage prohead protease
MMKHPVRIDHPDGVVLRGLGIPFGESTVIVENDGRIISERFDRESLVKLPANIPLLVGHDRAAPPAGVIDISGISDAGLAIEGRLIGSDHEVESWRKKFAVGLMTGLSIGFRSSGPQIHLRPERPGQPPVVVRRGVEIVEISLVSWAAYTEAAVISLNRRSAAGDESDRIKSEMAIFLADIAARRRRP